MNLSRWCRSAMMAVGMLIISVLAVVRVATACSHAPPNPPQVCIEQLSNTMYCIIIKNYNTGGGAQQGQFCTCALRTLGPIQSVNSFQMFRCGTTIPVQGWNFQPNSISSQAWSQILGGPATGFLSAVNAPVPPETCIDLKFIITVAPGTTPTQVAGALAGGGVIVGNGEADPTGRPMPGSFEVRPAGPIMIVQGNPCPADLDGDGVVTSMDFFVFLTAFFNGTDVADFNHDGAITSQDFFDYLAAFFTPC
ncbi:MAG: GC-type dockerin domain-anchored protein [Phycisphaerales bacterium]